MKPLPMQVRILSDQALCGALDQLRKTRQWPERREMLEREWQKRMTLRRGKVEA